MAQHRSLTFAERGATPLVGDLYRPEGTDACPVLLGVPGGGWRRGHREQLASWGAFLADQGFAVFSIDYRRSETGTAYPENIEDVHAALDFLNRSAESLGVDAARLGVLGASAGAHLAALVALRYERPLVRAAVLAYGVYDLTTHWRYEAADPRAEGLTQRMMGCSPLDDPQLYAEASPRHHVAGASARRLKALIVWGTADEVVQPEQSTTFAEALSRAGTYVETEPVAGAGHFWFSNDSIANADGLTAALAPKVARFLRRHLS